MFTLSGGHLFVLYDGAVQADLRLVDTRHEQTATFAAEGWAKVTRRLGCAALTAGPGVTNGVSAMTAAGMNGIADGRRRRSRAAAALGRRVAAGARPRADRRVGREARRDRDVGRVDRRRARRRVPCRADAAPRPDVRRHPARRRSVRRASTSRRSTRPRCVGATPDPAAVAGRRRRSSRRPSGRCCSPAATSTGRTPKARCVAFAEAARLPVFVQRHGPRHDPGRSRARVLASAVGRAAGSRPRPRRGNAARLPARVRPLRRRAGRAPVRRRDRGRHRTPTSRRRPAAICAATFTAARRCREPRPARTRLDRQAARRGTGEARGRGRDRSTTIATPIRPTRIYGELRAAPRPRRDRDR